MAYFYSTQSFLEWAFNHYFYDQVHYSWVAAPFYPYKQKNPASSNPYKIYGHLYEPWFDADPYDQFVESKRAHVRSGIIANSGKLTRSRTTRLKKICLYIDQLFLYPLVYRVDISRITPPRLDASSGSGATGSNEFLIRDLRESEFDVLFLDFDDDPDFTQAASGILSPRAALDLFESRC
jgi:hypothetical protein